MPKQTRTRPVNAAQARAEYEPDDIPKSDASKAVERARRIVEVARRLLGAQRS